MRNQDLASIKLTGIRYVLSPLAYYLRLIAWVIRMPELICMILADFNSPFRSVYMLKQTGTGNGSQQKFANLQHFKTKLCSIDCAVFSERERSRSLYAIARPSVAFVCLSVVCNVRTPYSGGSNFRQYFYGIRYIGHPLTSTENFTEIVSGEPLHRGS